MLEVSSESVKTGQRHTITDLYIFIVCMGQGSFSDKTRKLWRFYVGHEKTELNKILV